MERLDIYETLPSGMREYLANYGWHFSRAMCEWAISNMEDRNGNEVKMKSNEEVRNIIANNGVRLENDKAYDAVFVYHMGLSDYMGSSVVDEAHLAKYVKDVLDDKDGYDGIAFSRFVADCNGKGEPIMWEKML